MIFSPKPPGIPGKRPLISRSRKIVFFARDMLILEGYTVVRNSAVLPPVDLAAWKSGGDLLLIQIRRTRRPVGNARTVAEKFHTDLKQLQQMQKPGHTIVQIWLYSVKDGWKTYDVHPGGLMEAGKKG
jgi:hypothetical protein